MSNDEIYYNGIQIELFQRFGWAFRFQYFGNWYISDIDFVDIFSAKETAKQMVAELTKGKSGDNLELDV
jgi:hypothetical protein